MQGLWPDLIHSLVVVAKDNGLQPGAAIFEYIMTIWLFAYAGFVFYYGLIQITLWWLFHIATLFWIFRFPLHFRSFQKLKRIKYIHITCVILGLVVPILPIVVTAGDHAMDVKRNDSLAIPHGFGFGMTNFPPVLCAGLDSDASFYSLVLPILVLTEIGMTLLVFAFWDVRRVGSTTSKHSCR